MNGYLAVLLISKTGHGCTHGGGFLGFPGSSSQGWSPRGGLEHRHDAGLDGGGQPIPGGVDQGQIGVGLRRTSDNRTRLGGDLGRILGALRWRPGARPCAMKGRLSRGGWGGNHGEIRDLCASVRAGACACVNAPRRTRTFNPLIKSRVLYGVVSGF